MDIRVICKVTLCSTPYLLCFRPYPLFQWYPQSKEILLKLGMKCWNSAFNAQGSRIIIVVVQVGAVKIYVAGMKALRKKERQDESGQSEPAPMSPPVGRSVHRMGCVFHLPLYLTLTNILLQSIFFGCWHLTIFFSVANFFPTRISILPSHLATLLTYILALPTN